MLLTTCSFLRPWMHVSVVFASGERTEGHVWCYEWLSEAARKGHCHWRRRRREECHQLHPGGRCSNIRTIFTLFPFPQTLLLKLFLNQRYWRKCNFHPLQKLLDLKTRFDNFFLTSFSSDKLFKQTISGVSIIFKLPFEWRRQDRIWT